METGGVEGKGSVRERQAFAGCHSISLLRTGSSRQRGASLSEFHPNATSSRMHNTCYRLVERASAYHRKRNFVLCSTHGCIREHTFWMDPGYERPISPLPPPLPCMAPPTSPLPPPSLGYHDATTTDDPCLPFGTRLVRFVGALMTAVPPNAPYVV